MTILSTGTLVAFCILATTLETVLCQMDFTRGLPYGCADGKNICLCGETTTTFSMSYERCTYVWDWQFYCARCDKEMDFSAQCSKYSYCQDCGDDVDGCVSCPSNRFGKWCDMLYCSVPVIPRNSKLAENSRRFEGGASVTIVCNPKYQLIGSSTLLCGYDGNWIGDLPKCEPICQALEEPSGAIVTVTSGVPGTSVVRSIIYDCLPGYQLQGSNRIDCTDDGAWSGAPPSCVKNVSCPDPGIVGNTLRVPDARFFSKFHAGDVISFSCRNSFKMVNGDDTRVCLTTGSWSGEQPTCVPETACADPGVPDYSVRDVEISSVALSSVKQGSFEGIEFQYNSMSSVSLSISSVEPEPEQEDQRSSISVSTSEFNNEKQEDQEPLVILEGYFIAGTHLTYRCNSNLYKLYGSSNLTCTNGEWSGNIPTCKPETVCEAFKTPSNATAIVTSVVPGTSVVRSITYDCLPGYQLQGSNQIFCTENGTWSGDPPSCVAICGDPVPPMHGTVTWTGTHEGSRARYACDAGYIRNGAQETICSADQRWTQSSPICEPVNCGTPEIPEHGYLSATNFTYQGVATFTCEETYVFTEPPEPRTCLYTGEWSGTTPQCVKDVSCPDPGFVANAVRVPDANVATFHAGDFISFACSDSFKMVNGDHIRVCLNAGSWSGEQPTCVPVGACPDPGVPDYSLRDVKISPLAFADAKTRSFDRVRLTDNSVSESSSTSESDSVSTKEVREGSEEPEPEQEDQEPAVMLEGYFLAGTHLTYRCNSNLYKLHGSSELTCSNGEWSENTPTCKPVCGKATGSKQAYVIGGNDTIAGQWPWHTALYRNTNGKTKLICGASILTNTFVLTAAHCLKEKSSNQDVANATYHVEVGKYHRLKNKKDKEWVQSINVTEIIVHENYNPFTLEDDIAILRLERPMEFTARVRPVCLPSVFSTRRNLRPGNQGVLTGWGRTVSGLLPRILQQAAIPVVSRQECQSNYKKAYPTLHNNIIVTRNMFCAGLDKGGLDSCTGDSGGPLVFSRGEGEMKSWYIEGIVSWGSPGGKCGKPNEFGVYTKVTKYLAWLNRHGISN